MIQVKIMYYHINNKKINPRSSLNAALGHLIQMLKNAAVGFVGNLWGTFDSGGG